MDKEIDMFADWIPPPILETEYRLYYGEKGEVLFYTSEKPEGNFIVIDSQAYAECRVDIKVVDGKIIIPSNVKTITKLVVSDDGTKCPSEDVSIVADETYNGDSTFWEIKTNEL